MTPYNTLLNYPSGEIIHSSDTLALQIKMAVSRVHTLPIQVRRPTFAASIPYTIQYLLQSYSTLLFLEITPPFEKSIHSIYPLKSDSIDFTLSFLKISPCLVIPYKLLISYFIYIRLFPAIRLYTTIIKNTPSPCANPYIPLIS